MEINVPAPQLMTFSPDNIYDHEFIYNSIEPPEARINTSQLYQNYPNPFNPSTTIKFNLPKSSMVKIEVYNIRGQKIQTLLNKKMDAGSHQVEFNAENLSSGVYFCIIEVVDPARRTVEFQDVKKMILIK